MTWYQDDKRAKFTAYLHQYNVEFIDIKPLLSKGDFIAGKLHNDIGYVILYAITLFNRQCVPPVLDNTFKYLHEC